MLTDSTNDTQHIRAPACAAAAAVAVLVTEAWVSPQPFKVAVVGSVPIS